MAELMNDLVEIADLADGGNATAVAFMDWFLTDADEAETSGMFPSDRVEQAQLGERVGHTVSLYMAARCARFVADTGKAPDTFTLKISVGFESLT